jgi:hypothetical protein
MTGGPARFSFLHSCAYTSGLLRIVLKHQMLRSLILLTDPASYRLLSPVQTVVGVAVAALFSLFIRSSP